MILPAGTRVEAIEGFSDLIPAGESITGTVTASEVDALDGLEYVMVRLDGGKYVMGTRAENWRPTPPYSPGSP